MDSEGPIKAIRASLPYPPTINHYWRHTVRRGRVSVYVTPDGRAYRKLVKLILRGVQELTGRIRIEVLVHPPDARTRDLDNLLKCLFDSLTVAGVWGDDNQVDELLVVRGPVRKGGMVEVIASSITAKGGGQ